jgi:GAF domain-containing protein
MKAMPTEADQLRIIDELRRALDARTAELAETRAQQAATASILSAINNSGGDLGPVFDSILENAHYLCGAPCGSLQLYQDDRVVPVAIRGMTPAFTDYLARGYPITDGIREGLMADHATQRTDITEVLRLAPNEDSFRAAVELGGIRTMATAPLLRDGRAFGRIVAGRREVHPFDDRQLALLEAFANQAGIALQNARLFNEVQARTRDLEESLQQQTATADVLKVISRSAFDLQTVLDTLTESAARLCNADMAAITRAGPDGYYHATSYNFSIDWLKLSETLRLRPGQGSIVGRALAARKAVQIADVPADSEYAYHDVQKAAGFRTLLGVPMLRDGEPIGVLFLGRKTVNPFSDRQIELVSTFADQAVIAIENARLFDEVQAKTQDLTEALTYQTGSANILNVIASSPTDVAPVLKAIVESACGVCEAYDAAVVLRDGDDLRFSAHHGPIPIGLEKWPINRRWTAGRAFIDQKPVHIADLRDERNADFPDGRELSLQMGHRSILSVPLLRDKESIGAIVLRRTEVHPFNDKQIALLQTFADQAVIAIGNVRLFDEVQARTRDLQESLQQQTATAEVLKVISRSAFDLQPVFSTIVQTASRLCEAEFALIYELRGDRYEIVAANNAAEAFVKHAADNPLPPGRGSLVGRAALEGKPVHIPDCLADPEYSSMDYQAVGHYRTMLGVPLLREGVPIGVIGMMRTAVRPFNRQQIELVTTFADQAVIAIENVRLFDAVQVRTRELGQSLENLRTAQDRLIQTEKLASLGQLTAGIAHEIKNPLNFVNNFSSLSVELTDELNDLLKHAKISDDIRQEVDELTALLKDNLDKVVQHGKRADSIVKNMLLHSREGSGEHRPADINALVDESLNLAYHGARAEKPHFNVTLQRNFDPEAGVIEVFPQEITRVLLNLVSNGFYAVSKRKADNGDGSFEPAVTATTKGCGDHVEIRIRDNGTGIPADVKEKMFNPFFTTKPAGEGTGLGLSMSHDIIVKQHGGTIDVDTVQGEFTEFTIVLPRTSNLSSKSRG